MRLEGERQGWKHSLSMNQRIEKIHAIPHTMYQKEKYGFSIFSTGSWGRVTLFLDDYVWHGGVLA